MIGKIRLDTACKSKNLVFVCKFPISELGLAHADQRNNIL